MGRTIATPTCGAGDWERLHRPGQWKTGRSAKSLAYCWEEADGFPVSVATAMGASGVGELMGLEMLLGIPEYKVPLPARNTDSQNDLFVLGRGAAGLVVMMVEGKVDESFDKLVSDWWEGPPSGKQERLEFLCGKLGLTVDDVEDLRYQLLHRTVSALLEAERFGAGTAVMLVHSFHQDGMWFEDYQAFAERLGTKVEKEAFVAVGDFAGVNLVLGWVTGEAEYLER